MDTDRPEPLRPAQATFIGIGAQKSASTWLYGVLQQCPEVAVSDVKEVDHFPKDSIHVFFQEEINRDSAGMAEHITAALGLPPIENFLDLRVNESVRYRNAAVGKTLWKVGDFARRNGLGAISKSVKSLPGIRQMRQGNREEIRDVVAPMLPETKADLIDYYRDDVAKLETLLGRSVPWPVFG